MVAERRESRQVRRKLYRDQQRANRIQESFEQEACCYVNRLFKEIFTEQKLEELAKKYHVFERQRELSAFTIASILLMGCISEVNSNPKSLVQMCSLLRKRYDIYVKPQSLSAKINSKNTAKFIKAVMSEVLKHEVNKVLNTMLKKHKSKFKTFARILLQDSSVISLPDSLKRIFRGCGGSASKAAIKCDFIIDQSNNTIISVKYVSGRIPDSSLSKDIISFLEEGDLVIRDLGYFNLEQLLKIKQNKAYFISRLSINAHIFLERDDKTPMDLIKYMEKLRIGKKSIDIDVYVGDKARIPVRLIGVKVPEEVVEARRQQYKKSRGRSKEPSEVLKAWNGYTFMITNISSEELSIGMILKMYRVRWQIELFFKNMKSNISADELTGSNKYRIQCFIYTKIMITWIASTLFALAQMKGEDRISLPKFTKWLMGEGRFLEALLTGDVSYLLSEFERDMDLLCKQQRKSKKGTWEDALESYQEECIERKTA